MSFVRYFPLVLAVGGGLALLAGAGRKHTALEQPSIPFTPAPSAVPDAPATQLLDNAVNTLERRGPWLECTVRQWVNLPRVEFLAEGSYQAAPGNRFRLELRTQTAQSSTTLLTVGNGTHVWRARRTGDDAWKEVRNRDAKEALEGTGAAPPAPEEKENPCVPGFTGPGPLLRKLRSSLVWVKRTEMTADEQPAVELIGVWPREQTAKLMKNGASWPEGMPDRCHLLLDAETLWPLRVEWWGPTADTKGLTRMVQMELRAPVFDHPLSAEESNQQFSPAPQ